MHAQKVHFPPVVFFTAVAQSKNQPLDLGELTAGLSAQRTSDPNRSELTAFRQKRPPKDPSRGLDRVSIPLETSKRALPQKHQHIENTILFKCALLKAKGASVRDKAGSETDLGYLSQSPKGGRKG